MGFSAQGQDAARLQTNNNMEPDTDYHLVITTCPNSDVARRLADHVVENRLAACVNIISDITSVYRWQGKISTDLEQLLLMKSPKSRYPELEQAIKAMHPYELPEVVAVPIRAGLADYLAWIGDSCEK